VLENLEQRLGDSDALFKILRRIMPGSFLLERQMYMQTVYSKQKRDPQKVCKSHADDISS
jgi:hypothetical protein